MKFQAFHVNPGEKLKKKDVNNNLSHFMSVFPIMYYVLFSVISDFQCNEGDMKISTQQITIYMKTYLFFIANL